MRRTIGILFVTLITMGLMDVTPAIAVSNEDIQGTLQSLIYSYNQLDHKLERHEHRERSLGELLKKGIMGLQRSVKLVEPVAGIFGRLDERVSQIETMLIAQESKYNSQNDKFGEALDEIFKWMRENDACMQKAPEAIAVAPAAAEVPVALLEQQAKVNADILKSIEALAAKVESLQDTSKNMVEVAFKTLPSTNEMLEKIEDKLVSYSVVTPAPTVAEPVRNVEFENKVLEKFGSLESGLAVLQQKPSEALIAPPGLSVEDRNFLQGLNNETLHALEAVRSEALKPTDTVFADLTNSQNVISEDVAKVNADLTDAATVLTQFYTEMNASYTKFNDGLEIFNKFNNILMTNSEYVLDTQRKVEFGTLQVVQKIGNLLDKQRDAVVSLVKEQVDATILANQAEAMQNVSSIIETEISQVWRQVAIMNDEIAETRDLVAGIQNKNDLYVNETHSAVNSMSGKVEETKGHMMDMDTNLNFLMGKLSLMSQEFRNIKIGLAQSLEELRNTFQSLGEKMPAQGPGPHTIPNSEYDTELNLLQKRHTPATP